MNGHIRTKAKDSKIKEACRIFWIVKGHLKATESCILNSYDSYFKRVWYMEEAYYREEGFEEAYNKYVYNNRSEQCTNIKLKSSRSLTETQ